MIELIEILESICGKNDYVISDGLKNEARDYFAYEATRKNEHFANGRLARNLYDDLVMNHARRVSTIENPSDDDLVKLTEADFDKKID